MPQNKGVFVNKKRWCMKRRSRSFKYCQNFYDSLSESEIFETLLLQASTSGATGGHVCLESSHSFLAVRSIGLFSNCTDTVVSFSVSQLMRVESTLQLANARLVLLCL